LIAFHFSEPLDIEDDGDVTYEDEPLEVDNSGTYEDEPLEMEDDDTYEDEPLEMEDDDICSCEGEPLEVEADGTYEDESSEEDEGEDGATYEDEPLEVEDDGTYEDEPLEVEVDDGTCDDEFSEVENNDAYEDEPLKLKVEDGGTYEDAEVQAVFMKLIKVLKCLSLDHQVPFSILHLFHEDSNLVNLALELLQDLKFVTLNVQTKMVEPDYHKIRVFAIPVRMKKADKIAILRDILKTLADLTSLKSTIPVAQVLPHALNAWKIARTCDILFLEYIYIFPIHIINRLSLLDDDSRFYLDFGKQTLADFGRLNNDNPQQYAPLYLKYHVATALLRLHRYGEAWKVLVTLLRAVDQGYLLEKHWLTLETLKYRVYILEMRKNFERAYQEQTEVCNLCGKYCPAEETVEQYFIKARIMYKLGKFVEAKEVFRSILDWKLSNGEENNSEEIGTWIQKCGIGIRAEEAKVIAEDILIKNPDSLEMRKIMSAAETLRRVTMERSRIEHRQLPTPPLHSSFNSSQ